MGTAIEPEMVKRAIFLGEIDAGRKKEVEGRMTYRKHRSTSEFECKRDVLKTQGTKNVLSPLFVHFRKMTLEDSFSEGIEEGMEHLSF